MQEVSRGEGLSSDGMIARKSFLERANLTVVLGSDNIEAALCFYKALKVYPQPSDLISIYGQYPDTLLERLLI